MTPSEEVAPKLLYIKMLCNISVPFAAVYTAAAADVFIIMDFSQIL